MITPMCECPSADCFAYPSGATIEEYVALRERLNRDRYFLVAIEHLDPAMEVIEKNERFAVVTDDSVKGIPA